MNVRRPHANKPTFDRENIDDNEEENLLTKKHIFGMTCMMRKPGCNETIIIVHQILLNIFSTK